MSAVCVCNAVGCVIERLPLGKPVFGVTLLDNHLLVLREQIEDYDVTSFRLLRCFSISGLDSGDDIVACEHNRCAYVSNFSNKCIHRLALPDAEATQWNVSDRPSGLSLTVTHGVLVTCPEVRQLKEFSTNGKLIRTLPLPDSVVSPMHAIHLSSARVLVSHGEFSDPVHRVCLVRFFDIDFQGNSEIQLPLLLPGIVLPVVDRALGGPKGAGSQQMNVPASLAVDENSGHVFVADQNNSRVLLLSPTWKCFRELVSRDQLQMNPLRLHLDAANHRLYIAVNRFDKAEWTVGRVVVVSV